MGFLVTKSETATETIYVYHRSWLIYLGALVTIALGFLASIVFPDGRLLKYAGWALFLIWWPLLIWFYVHVRRLLGPSTTVTGHKTSRSNPLTLRVPKDLGPGDN